MGREGDPGRPVERRDGVFHDAQFAARQREETNRLDGHLDAVFQHDPHAARQHRAAHVRLAVKALHLRDGRQVERLAVDRDIDPDPERGVRDLGEILRVAVLPPPHAGLVGIIDPADIIALKRLARVTLLEIGPAPITPLPSAKSDSEESAREGSKRSSTRRQGSVFTYPSFIIYTLYRSFHRPGRSLPRRCAGVAISPGRSSSPIVQT